MVLRPLDPVAGPEHAVRLFATVTDRRTDSPLASLRYHQLDPFADDLDAHAVLSDGTVLSVRSYELSSGFGGYALHTVAAAGDADALPELRGLLRDLDLEAATVHPAGDPYPDLYIAL